MVHSSQTADPVPTELHEATRSQLELAAFGETHIRREGRLAKAEIWWSQHYDWLKDCGYLLRPRYAPDWVPSWQDTKKDRFLCEDGQVAMYPSRILDGTRLSDGTFVTLKLVEQSDHPYEVDIARFLSSEPLVSDPQNHCVPIFDVLTTPEDKNIVIIVMPLLRDYNEPSFDTIGEGVDCFRQLFEGLQFMHKHRVAHRDCMSLNIMMDARHLYIDAFHPVYPIMKRNFSGFARYKTRTQRPPKYFFIDFGISRRYDASVKHPLEDPIWGGDKTVPEFQNSNEPRDPFPTDVYYIGNVIREDFLLTSLGFEFMVPLLADMLQDDPSKRPTMDEVVQRFDSIRASLSSWKLRSRVVERHESAMERMTRATAHWARRVWFVVRRVPAIPTPSS
ncbi:hypothetical protein F5I97DRAFT_1935427 [Phlebopus sp. FC_14]|nr:hypothetical protein F5I97DRAFT_1935427 [Phlebopus sp. FC_14]